MIAPMTRASFAGLVMYAVSATWGVGCGGGGSQAYPDAVAATGGRDGGASTGGRANTGGADAGSGTGGIRVLPDASSSDGPPVVVADFNTQLIAATCAYYVRCGIFPTVASCQSTNYVGPGILTLQADVATATVLYDAAQAGACLESIRNTSCSITAQVAQGVLPDPCLGVFTGTIAPGGTCFSSGECSSGGGCLLAAACTTGCCAGTCVAPAVSGGNCASAPCPAGTYCRQVSATVLRCTPQATAEGAVCDSLDGCAPPLFCALDATGASASCIRSLPATGGVCNPNTGCDDLHDYCNGTGVCVGFLTAGQACTGLVGGECGFSGYCNAASVCQAFGAAGAVCVSDATGATDCLGSLVCPAPAMTCTAPPASMSCR